MTGSVSAPRAFADYLASFVFFFFSHLSYVSSSFIWPPSPQKHKAGGSETEKGREAGGER